ncbi:hypothetical protein SALBM135S_06169 [Streptomyces alboniger]
MTFVPGFQYLSGRKSTRVSPNQCGRMSTAGREVTLMARWTASRFSTSRLNSRETIMPVPTVARFSGVTYPMKRSSGT